MSEAWVSAYNARRLAADRRDAWGADALSNVETALIDQARTVLPARCDYLWEKVLTDEGDWTHREEWAAAIPKWVWDLSDDLSLDWRSGIFHLSGERNGQVTYVKLVGLSFAAAEVHRLWPDESELIDPQPVSGASISSRGGAPRDSEKWDSITIAAVRLANDGKLDSSLEGRFKSQAEFRRAILDDPDCARLDVKDDTIKPLMRKIWLAMRLA